MPNSYYNRVQTFTPYTTARGPEVTGEYDLVETGFDSVEAAIDVINGAIGDLSSGSPPGWGNPLDTRWYVLDTSSSTTTYTATPAPAPAGAAVLEGYRIYFLANNTNTAAATLNIGSSEGAIPIYKLVDGARVAIEAGDITHLLSTELVFEDGVWMVLDTPADVVTGPIITPFTISGTITYNAKTKFAIIEGVGGGGGGGGSDNGARLWGGGGASGGYFKGVVNVDADSIASGTITIGTGGAGGTNSVDGSNGTSTSYSDGTNSFVGGGGTGGASDNNLNTKTVNGGSATGAGITINGIGSNKSEPGGSATGGDFGVGEGRGSMFGEGGHTTDFDTASPGTDRDGQAYGSGGATGSAESVNAASESGGEGGDGVVYVYEYV